MQLVRSVNSDPDVTRRILDADVLLIKAGRDDLTSQYMEFDCDLPHGAILPGDRRYGYGLFGSPVYQN